MCAGDRFLSTVEKAENGQRAMIWWRRRAQFADCVVPQLRASELRGSTERIVTP